VIQREVAITNRLGLHMRAAGKFARMAGQFRSSVNILRDGQMVDGKSIVGLLTLAAAQGSTLILRIEGADEEQAFEALKALMDSKFGEDQ
jgi:phosphocarrier protein HPr